MFIIRKTAFSNWALIKAQYYLDRLLLFSVQWTVFMSDRYTDWQSHPGLFVSDGGKGFLYPGHEKIPGHKYRMLPMSSSGKKIQPWFYSFFVAFLLYVVPFVSFSSQDSLNILASETAAFIDSRRRKRSWFWSFFPFCPPASFFFRLHI